MFLLEMLDLQLDESPLLFDVGADPAAEFRVISRLFDGYGQRQSICGARFALRFTAPGFVANQVVDIAAFCHYAISGTLHQSCSRMPSVLATNSRWRRDRTGAPGRPVRAAGFFALSSASC